ncbi:MAG: proline dehydrogenase family protein [Gemmatimonadota bacterium]
MLRQSLLWASRNPWLAHRLPRYRFMRRAVRRFLPGEDAEAALGEGAHLKEGGMTVLLTRLGENVRTQEEADRVAAHYLEVLDRALARSIDAQLSVKLTQLGLDLGPETALRNVRSLVERAAALHSLVWIDMEGSPYTDVTLDLFRRIRAEHPAVGVCLQAYLHRSERDLESLLPLRPSIRLVKGAYAEPSSIAFPRKAEVDANYRKLAARLLEEAGPDGRVWPAFGTHDPRLIQDLREAADSRGLDPSAYEFEMLYGIGRERQARLAADGYRMRVLISYGDAWFPWYMRRLAERPANLGFVVRSLFSS